ncbi:MAG TPA: DNA repair protein RecN, partial [Gammaproteobacteria bacterium]|nr:DNA repair protein RecN [Gammaproteobacteria bacterium]
MLNHISIRNFVLVEKLDIDLTQGLTVVTGESGAGKSIFLDAIGMVLGNRVSKSLIRPSQDHCEVSVEFNLAENEGA